MAELVPIPMQVLLRRMHHEYERCRSIYDLPERKFYAPDPSLDLTVVSNGNSAANPVGPAAGPHTQLAQNIVLSWLAGARIIELKTVQLNDRLELTRPCIDIATVGYNTEWSQELRLHESAREYVKASMLVAIIARRLYGADAMVRHADGAKNFDTVFDLSVGYDLAGIQSPEIRGWLRTMQNASSLIEELRCEIPDEFKAERDLPFAAMISNSITLSTFHGAPADEIERICRFLITEMGFNVVVKMNPPMLGKERLEHLLHEALGYAEIEVNPGAYDVNLRFDDAAAMMRRLEATAVAHGKHIGVKFGNTLEVINKGSFLREGIQYLSGQPLHVIHVALVEAWRREFGADFPVSFSAGVDANNAADCVSMGLVPVTACTDLLRPGGYGRLKQYLVNIEQRMKLLGARTIGEFIVRTAEHRAPHVEGAGRGEPSSVAYAQAVMANTASVAAGTADDPRYRSANIGKPPRKIGSHLALWDCISCDKCIPVCPNDANFAFSVKPVSLTYRSIEITDSGWKETEEGTFAIRMDHQIGTYADACNECGNCDVFCPEDGGPYLEKPRFFGTRASFEAQRDVDGFLLFRAADETVLRGRISGSEYELSANAGKGISYFQTPVARLTIETATGRVLDAVNRAPAARVHVEMKLYHTMAALMEGAADTAHVNFVTIASAKG